MKDVAFKPVLYLFRFFSPFMVLSEISIPSGVNLNRKSGYPHSHKTIGKATRQAAFSAASGTNYTTAVNEIQPLSANKQEKGQGSLNILC